MLGGQSYLVFLMLFFAANAFAGPRSALFLAGNERGNGTDNRNQDSDSAWFLGPSEVNYCLEVDENFGVSMSEAELNIAKALATWKSYILEKKIHKGQIPEFRLATNFKNLGRCAAVSDAAIDLKFLFGLSNAAVHTDIKALGLENPTAFALRQSYDRSTGRGKGYIWLAPPKSVYPGTNFPDWTLPYAVNGILLHELGHVYGCGHVEDTIMQENLTPILQMITSSPKRAGYALTHIDDMKELIPCQDCSYDWQGELLQGDEHRPRAEKTFSLFTGREAHGEIKVRMRRTIDSDVMDDARPKFILSDDHGQDEFVITLVRPVGMTWTPYYQGNNRLFSIYRNSIEDGPRSSFGYSYSDLGFVEYGHLTTKTNKNLTVILERNMTWKKLRVSYLDDGVPYILFDSVVPRLP